jgi:hypothetical protein
MMRVCLIEMEGVLLAHDGYSPDKKRVESFLKKLSNYTKKEKIKLYLLSGYHEKVAKKKFDESNLKKYFNKEYFFYVDEEYISKKADVDKKIHIDALQTDPMFVDSYFKQVAMQKIVDEQSIPKEEILLLCNDIWVDAYYTTRFTKVNFALFEENILERGNKTERVSGLAYFSFEFNSVKQLIEDFPKVDLGPLGKFIFNIMQKVIMSNVDLSGVVKKISKNKQGVGGGLDETKIN